MFLQQLRLLEGFDLGAMGHGSAEYVHAVTECAKLAFADREAWYGDPAFSDVPIATCSPARTPTSGVRSSATTASAELRPGRPTAASPGSPTPVDGAPRPAAGRRRADAASKGDTVHLDVVDRSGTWSPRRRAAAGSGVRR